MAKGKFLSNLCAKESAFVDVQWNEPKVCSVIIIGLQNVVYKQRSYLKLFFYNIYDWHHKNDVFLPCLKSHIYLLFLW